MKSLPPLLALCLVAATGSPAPAQTLEEKLLQFFEAKCTDCHGEVEPARGLNVLNHPSLIDASRRIVTPGVLETSKLWIEVVQKKTMPQGGESTPEEIAVLEEWIKKGAPDFRPSLSVQRTYISQADVYQAIRDDLDKYQQWDRKYLRYFTLSHLYNNTNVSEQDMRKFRAALSKLINSLTWKPDVHLPIAVDAHQTVLRIDLRELGWFNSRTWNVILSQYPYGVVYSDVRDNRLRILAQSIYDDMRTDLPELRADWFVANASQPPLYHQILNIPKNIAELEKRLGVDPILDFQLDQLRRAGMTHSFVSEHNRLVDRHDSLFGAYWKSYDFAGSVGRQEINQFPLGPEFADHPFPDDTFQHDGGEMVFSLPNGLQGYMITDAKGNRLDRAPANVVADKNKPLGNTEVINGISCMVCHEKGVVRFIDAVRNGTGVRGPAGLKVEKLFILQPEMDRLLDRDERRFLLALTEATGPFLQVAEDQQKPITEFKEPIGVIARTYYKDLTFHQVITELGYNQAEAEKYRAMFGLGELAGPNLGLRGLTTGGTIKRETWCELKTSSWSRFQIVASKLELGSPKRVLP